MRWLLSRMCPFSAGTLPRLQARLAVCISSRIWAQPPFTKKPWEAGPWSRARVWVLVAGQAVGPGPSEWTDLEKSVSIEFRLLIQNQDDPILPKSLDLTTISVSMSRIPSLNDMAVDVLYPTSNSGLRTVTPSAGFPKAIESFSSQLLCPSRVLQRTVLLPYFI